MDQREHIEKVVDGVRTELQGRLGTRLSEADQLAVETAVIKAAMRGFAEGVKLHTHQLYTEWQKRLPRLRQVAPDLADVVMPAATHLTVAEPDKWADAHGGS